MEDRLIRQLALDYCCTPAQVRDGKNHFTEYSPLPGRRMFQESGEGCFLKMAAAGGKLLVTGQREIVAELEEKLRNVDGAWSMDADALAGLNGLLDRYGREIGQAHLFFTADRKTAADTVGFDLIRYESRDIGQFRGDPRYGEAFAFSEYAPDVLGIGAFRDGQIAGMAGASADSPLLWQIGINTMAPFRGSGVGSMLVTLLKNEVLEQGRLPYYGTALSHVLSQRVALRAGFLPAWAELTTRKKTKESGND